MSFSICCCDDVYSDLLEPDGKRRKLTSLKRRLLKACIAILAQDKQKYALPGLHLNSAKKTKPAQLNALLTEDDLQKKGWRGKNTIRLL